MKRYIQTLVFIILICSFVKGQKSEINWYSETENNGIIIQNSFPKGGPYTGPTDKFYNYSYLVFFSRIKNQTVESIELSLEFTADSVAIPNSPNTFMKLFLPPDTMTLEKQHRFSYGITELDAFDKPTRFERSIKPEEDCLLYVVAIFYQTNVDAWNQERGGNRAELVLEGQSLFYRIPPQVDSLYCGQIQAIRK